MRLNYMKPNDEHGLNLIKMFLASNKELVIGTSNPDKLYDRIKAAYPDAKLSKHKGYVMVEKQG